MTVKRSVRAIGVNPRTVIDSVKGLSKFRANRQEFSRQANGRTAWEIGNDWPCLADRYDQSGVANGQYFHQDLYVAQQIFQQRPEQHLDAGSRVDGFVAHVATFMPIEVLDIRPLTTSATNITFSQRDLMKPDPTFDNCTDSLSCLHTLEHFGLGRYGDTIDYDGYLRGWSSLSNMVRPGGRFYFSVPISQRQRIEFDAHRLFGVPHLLEMIDPIFDIVRIAVVDDSGELREDLKIRSAEASRTFDIEYGCIIFVLLKR